MYDAGGGHEDVGILVEILEPGEDLTAGEISDRPHSGGGLPLGGLAHVVGRPRPGGLDRHVAQVAAYRLGHSLGRCSLPHHTGPDLPATLRGVEIAAIQDFGGHLLGQCRF